MNKRVIWAALGVLAVSATGAMAQNELVLLPASSFSNIAEVSFDGNNNRLAISQEHTGGNGTNTITATIKGDLNGGPLGATFRGAALASGMQPGTLTQSGFNNAMTVSVEGTSNLFAFAQIGSGNTLHASISGYDNQAAVSQTGSNNFAAFSQNGIGNIVSISQQSW